LFELGYSSVSVTRALTALGDLGRWMAREDHQRRQQRQEATLQTGLDTLNSSAHAAVLRDRSASTVAQLHGLDIRNCTV